MSPIRHALPLLAPLLAAALAGPAGADDEGIYGANAPPQSAFVRLFNASGGPLAGATLDGAPLDDLAPYEASEFEFTAPGSHTLSAGGVKESVSLEKNRYYTAVLRDGKISLIGNERYRNRMKALVLLYNLLDSGPVSLKTADGRTTVIEAVKPNASGGREINAVKTALAVYEGNSERVQVKPMVFERGSVFSLFVSGPKDNPVAVWVIN